MNLSPARGSLHGGLMAALVVGVLAVHGALFRISHVPGPRTGFGDEYWYVLSARQIASGGVVPAHPIWPPVYPHFLAGIEAMGGGLYALEVVQTLMLLAVALILGDLSRHLSGSPVVGAVAGTLVLIYPPLVAFAHYRWPEVLHLLLFISAIWLLVRQAHRPFWLLACGLLLGLAIQTKQILWPFLPILLLPLVLRGTWRERALRPALVILTLGLVVVAPTHRARDLTLGVRLFSSPILNLWVGLNDRSRQSFVDPVVNAEVIAYEKSAATFSERNRLLLEKTWELARERGLVQLASGQLSRQYFRLFNKESFLTDQLPAGKEAAVKKKAYSGPDPVIAQSLRWSSYLLYSVILAGAAFGLAVCPHRGRWWILVGLAFLAYNLVIFFFLHVKSRYRIQLLPFLFFYNGCTVAWVMHKLGILPHEADGWEKKIGPATWAAATLGASLLLFLAWGGPLLD